MFGKLKEKLKKTLSIFSKKAQELSSESEEGLEKSKTPQREVSQEPVEEKKEKPVEEVKKTVEESGEKEKIKEIVEKKKKEIKEQKIVGEETREKIHKEGFLHQEVHVLLFNDKGEVILQRRGLNKETFPGLLDASVGGHVDLNEDSLSSAVREVEEEVGLKIEKKDLIFLGDLKKKFDDKKTNKINYGWKKIYGYQLKGNEKLRLEKDEAAGLEFLSIKKILSLTEKEKHDFAPGIVSGEYLNFFKKIIDLAKRPKPVPETRPAEEEKPKKEKIEGSIPQPEIKEPKGFFARAKEYISTKQISSDKFDGLFWDLELALLENNVSVEVIEKIKSDLKEELVDKPLPRDVEKKIEETLKKSLEEVLDIEKIDLIKKIKEKKPFIIAFFGINGSGKTTTLAKIAYLLKKNDLTSVLAAGDTFRAAAIQQLEEHTNNLKLKIIKHDYGSDAAAVAYDAVKYAEKQGLDVVLIDTAGRLHSDSNLMDELEKIVRVVKPDMKIFVGESITGNDCVEQASRFNERIGIDGIILTKADVDEKGGAAISVSFITKKPILFIGTGQEYSNLKEFDAGLVLDSLGLK